MQGLYQDANAIIKRAIEANMPEASVRAALGNHSFTGDIYLAAIGKAAWSMAKAAHEELEGRIKKGIVITKYEHAYGPLPGIEIIEAGHPVIDENTFLGTQKVLDMTKELKEGDELLFLVSGGGSALFEKPMPGISLEELQDVTGQMLASGADIVEINMVRKRLSSVKGGKFAKLCAPAKVFTVVLSDVLGDRLDSIASGPAAPDLSTVEDAMNVVKKYKLNLSDKLLGYMQEETPKSLDNVKSLITGSVRLLAEATATAAKELGYTPHLLCAEMSCEAREAGRLLSAIARQVGGGPYSPKRPCALIFGGETLVTLKGKGKGGRNQELALAAAAGIAGLEDVLVFSLGSDGTDGPTDAAGGFSDGTTVARLKEKGIKLQDALDNNDAYHALAAIDALIKTGPTGTNVNDVSVILCK